MKLPSVRLSVRPSVCPGPSVPSSGSHTPLRRVRCCWSAGQKIAARPALCSKCEQCHVASWRRKLNIDYTNIVVFIIQRPVCRVLCSAAKRIQCRLCHVTVHWCLVLSAQQSSKAKFGFMTFARWRQFGYKFDNTELTNFIDVFTYMFRTTTLKSAKIHANWCRRIEDVHSRTHWPQFFDPRCTFQPDGNVMRKLINKCVFW